jgi:putative protease
MASEDLCLVKYLAWLVKNNIQALKIEGRMKTVAYVAQVVDVYKTALKDLQDNNFRPALYWQELLPTITRPLGSGFFLGNKRKIFLKPTQKKPVYVLARIAEKLAHDRFVLQVKQKWTTPKDVTILIPGLKRPKLSKHSYILENLQGKRQETLHSGQETFLRADHPELKAGLLLRSS